MKTFIKILLVMVTSATLLQAATFEKDAKFRTTQVHISAQKPLTSGMNELEFVIKKDNTLIRDAKVSIKAFMPAMPGMPAMSFKADALQTDDGKYSAKLNFSMNGTWQLHIFITPKSGKKMRVKTSLNF